jgi:cytochrome bd-type quinol oxidase subunit 2
MIQKLKLLILSMSSLFLIAAPLAVSASVSAAPPPTFNQNTINGNLCAGTSGDLSGTATGPTGDCTSNGATDKVSNLITTIINIISAVVGIIAVIMIIVAGLRYVTSGGKEEGVKNAKNTILYAIIGLVVVALAQLIVHFVLNKTTQAVPS